MSECIHITDDFLCVGSRRLSYEDAISLLGSFTHMELYKVYKPAAAFFQKDEFDSFYTPVFEEILMFFLTNFMDVSSRQAAREILEASVTTADYERIFADALLATIGKISDCGGICN